MTEQILLWIVGISLIPILGWSISIIVLLRDIKKTGDVLLAMHQDANGAGFGTVALSEAIAKQGRTTAALIHYVRWAVTRITGEEPPPPLENPKP